MYFRRMFFFEGYCSNCGNPEDKHKYVTTDRDGDLLSCPPGSVQLTIKQAMELERKMVKEYKT